MSPKPDVEAEMGGRRESVVPFPKRVDIGDIFNNGYTINDDEDTDEFEIFHFGKRLPPGFNTQLVCGSHQGSLRSSEYNFIN